MRTPSQKKYHGHSRINNISILKGAFQNLTPCSKPKQYQSQSYNLSTKALEPTPSQNNIKKCQKKTKFVQVQRQGPRHAHSEGKTGPRLLTHRFIQNHSELILGKRAVALLEQSRGMPPQNPENAQKFHFCTIQKSQFDFHTLTTTTNDSRNLKPIRNTNLTT